MYTLKVTNLFLDRAAVVRAAGVAGVRVLSRVGSFVWKRARTSMPYRKKGSSAAGTPPFAHPQHGSRLRKLLFYSYDPSSKSVVVGSIALGNKGTVGSTVPNLQEFGGRVMRRVRRPKFDTGRKATPAQKQAYRQGLRDGTIDSPGPRTVVTYAATYPARAYMGPALQAENAAGRVLGPWAGSVKGAA